MSHYDSSCDVAVRAATQRMAVQHAIDSTYSVISESGSTYAVNCLIEDCGCEFSAYNPSRRCKHVWRVLFAIGAESVPDVEGVDPLLGALVEDNHIEAIAGEALS